MLNYIKKKAMKCNVQDAKSFSITVVCLTNQYSNDYSQLELC